MKTDFVADSSVAISWTVSAQSNQRTEDLRRELVVGGTFLVPALWFLEVANGLVILLRRRKIEPAERSAAHQALIELDPQVDEEASRLAFGAISDLALAHALTVYDAAYLELAIRRGLPLASRDNALNKAARTCGVETLL